MELEALKLQFTGETSQLRREIAALSSELGKMKGAVGSESGGGAVGAMSLLRGELVKLGAGLLTLQTIKSVTTGFVEMAESAKLAEARLKLVTSSSAELVKVQTELFRISQRLGLPVQDLTNLYTGLGRSLKETGVTTSDSIKLIETISLALKASGASAEAATSGHGGPCPRRCRTIWYSQPRWYEVSGHDGRWDAGVYSRRKPAGVFSRYGIYPPGYC